ncbi:MAG: ABC transporter ATP-binding protein [Candidatus Rokubacteria bacterium]|nr:ABC transporter ATP-binding protein [Candidatus Rokubacteria bacterium]
MFAPDVDGRAAAAGPSSGPAGPSSGPAGPPLRLDRLTKQFPGRRALDDLSLAVDAGEIYALIGPNGSGKTTTVKLTTGLYRPTSGRVLVRGIDAHAEPERAKRLIGYVPDEPFAYDRMSGREFLHLIGELWGVPRAERTCRIDALAGHFRIGELLDGDVEHYSRGTRQKLALCAAMLHAPVLLVIDEPIVGLDPESAIRTRELLRDFAARGGAVLLCTHTLAFAEAVCHRVGMLRSGTLVVEGDLPTLRGKAEHGGASLEDLYLEFAGTP